MKKSQDKLICSGHFAELETMQDINKNLKKEDNIDDLARIFKGLGDPTRLKIIYVLSQSALCVCDISILLDMSQTSISHHLRILRDLNLVKFQREGKLVIYSLDDDHVLRLFEEGLKHTKHI